MATGSSVFYAMFYGGLAENKNEIKVPDVEPSAFLTLLRLFYPLKKNNMPSEYLANVCSSLL